MTVLGQHLDGHVAGWWEGHLALTQVEPGSSKEDAWKSWLNDSVAKS